MLTIYAEISTTFEEQRLKKKNKKNQRSSEDQSRDGEGKSTKMVRFSTE